MGVYQLSTDEIIDSFEDYLNSQEGDISAIVIVKAWNELAKKYGWKDFLTVIKSK